MITISRGDSHLAIASQSNPALEMRLMSGETFLMFPSIIKMGFYFSWIQSMFVTDQEFMVQLLRQTMKEKSPLGNLP